MRVGAAACLARSNSIRRNRRCEKPSPQGEGVTPLGVTDVGSIIFLGGSGIHPGSPPHPSRLAPCHPLQQERAFSLSWRLFHRILPLKCRQLAHRGMPPPLACHAGSAAYKMTRLEASPSGSFLYPIFTSPSGQGLLRTRARWKCRRGGWWTDPHWCRQRP